MIDGVAWSVTLQPVAAERLRLARLSWRCARRSSWRLFLSSRRVSALDSPPGLAAGVSVADSCRGPVAASSLTADSRLALACAPAAAGDRRQMLMARAAIASSET